MTVHKLTAGSGYTYLTRQVAVQDAVTGGRSPSLGAYYAEKGEAPGVWMGTGLATVPQLAAGQVVTEPQMMALFGAGRHPDAEQIERDARAAGASPREVDRASRLGAPFPIADRASEFERRSARAVREYNQARGLPPDAPLDIEERAGVRTELARVMFAEAFGRAPSGPRELSGHLARLSRPGPRAVAGYDLCFSPVKSVSTLWALAPPDVAARIERAHADAVADTLAWLERNASYTRRGRSGVAQVDVRGLIAAAFTHRDSRAGDPDLHTHVAVSNKVQALDGTWLALDGRLIYQNNVAASERYNTRLEALLTDRLGVTFADRPQSDPGKRPVREIVGVDGPLPALWSTRRADIDAVRAGLSAAFQAAHGRPPTAVEAIGLAQEATVRSRPVKHAPRSRAEQRAAWRAEASAVLGGEAGVGAFVAAVLTPRRQHPNRPTADHDWVQQAALDVLARVAEKRATWQAHHVRAEAERHARTTGLRLTEVDRAVDAVVTEALARSVSLEPPDALPDVDVTPGPLVRADGSSVFTVAGSATYTSAAVLAAEEAIVTAAARRDGRILDPDAVRAALADCATGGMTLNPGQARMVRELACSGARVQLALAPAGTGKTTALRALVRSWTTSSDAHAGTVVGLAPSAAAAAVLAEEIGGQADTLAKLTHALRTSGDRPDLVPAWVSGIAPGTLVIIDEAGMAATTTLAETIEFVLGRGGSVCLVGDDQQLAAVGAGGVLRDVARMHGAVSLSQVVRFTHAPGHPRAGLPHHAEGAASLALREGDPAAIGFYLDHDRVHVGDQATALEQAYAAWAADRAAGRDSVLLAPTRELVLELNTRARRDRLTAAARVDARPHLPAVPGAAAGRDVAEVALADTSRLSAGDTIITRRNNRRIPTGTGGWVRNGDRWIVLAVRGDGGLLVRRRHGQRTVTLPAAYVAEHVTLGYASTVHGAQGITADTAHTVALGSEDRQLLYVALTRGRQANHLYLSVVGDGDPHTALRRDALIPPTAADLLARILERDAAPVSATSQAAAAADPAGLMAAAAGRYEHALMIGVEELLGETGMARIAAAADEHHPGLTAAASWPALHAQLALLTLDGHSPTTALHAAADRGVPGAVDVAALLSARLRTAEPSAGPLPWLPAVPGRLAADPYWGLFLRGQAAQIDRAASALATEAAGWKAGGAPGWALPLLDRARTRDPDLLGDLAVWRAATGVPDADLRPAGPPTNTATGLAAASEARARADLQRRALRVIGRPGTDAGRWQQLARRLDPRLVPDPYWPILADRLAAADRAGLPVADLLTTAAGLRPLPDEQPAAALWWRLSDQLSPAALAEADATDALTADWTTTLVRLLGATAAARVQADPGWTALVAAVTAAPAAGWEPDRLLATAYELLRAGQDDEEPLRAEELATALTWRVTLLTDAAYDNSDSSRPVGPAPDPDPEPPVARPPSPALTPPLAPAAPHPEVPAAKVVPTGRLLELNAVAVAFFAGHYRQSWAAPYLAGRLGRDPADDPRSRVGYAPAGWSSLCEHLRARGASDQEIVAAGLGRQARTGRLIDTFRDRLIFPIRSAPADGAGCGEEVHGFIGRRNPAHDNEDTAGPKYLNTPHSAVFVKGREMYGLAEGAAALAAGATPVLVEGPVDALAVTLAGGGEFVGLAPLGTALTGEQADLLAHATPRTTSGRARVIVATDNDPAGRRAAHRAFWTLTDRDMNPCRLLLPAGADPADLLATQGPDVLAGRLRDAPPLADALVEEAIAPWVGQFDTPDGRVHALRAAVPIIAALPAEQWAAQLAPLVAHIRIDPLVAIRELCDASDKRKTTTTPGTAAPASHTAPVGHGPPAAADGAGERWADLAEAASPGLTADPDWPDLAAALDRAQASGYDVTAGLPQLAARPLAHDHAARSLRYRLANTWPASLSDTAKNPSLHPRRDDPTPTDETDDIAIPMPWQIEPQHRRGI